MSGLAKALAAIERAAGRLQGKGYGTRSVAQEVALVARALGQGPMRHAVDIGGNVGNYTAALFDRFPGARVDTFEPSATNIAKLSKRFADRPNWTLHPVAVSDRAGEATLHADQAGSGLGSLTKRDISHVGLTFEVSEPVQTIRFEDHWRKVMGAPQIDVLKLDIEGHELAALSGMGAALDRVRVVQFEFGGCNIDTGTYLRDFWQFFDARGFALSRIAPIGLVPLTRYRERLETFDTTNYLAIRR